MKITLTQEQLEYGNSGKDSFDPVPEGHYLAKVHGAEITTFNSGNKGLVVDFVITDGDYKNRHVFERFVFVKNSMWKIGALLLACGLRPKADEEFDFSASDVVGANVKINVGIDTYEKNGEERASNRVKFVDPPPKGALAGHDSVTEGLSFD